MAERKNRYKQLEQVMSAAIIADFVLFILFLVVAGKGIIWAKVITAILCLVISFGSVGYLYLTKEMLRARSLWITFAAGAIALCVMFAVILNFPSPHPRDIPREETAAAIVEIIQI